MLKETIYSTQTACNRTSSFYKDNLSNLIARYTEIGVCFVSATGYNFAYQTDLLNTSSSDLTNQISISTNLIDKNNLQIISEESFRGKVDIYSLDGKLVLSNKMQVLQHNIIPISKNLNGIHIIYIMDLDTHRFRTFKIHF